MTAIVRVENTVNDFDAWYHTFRKFDAFRDQHHVRSYRISRSVANPDDICIDLDFDAVSDAESFAVALSQVLATPQSQRLLAAHREPRVVEVVA